MPSPRTRRPGTTVPHSVGPCLVCGRNKPGSTFAYHEVLAQPDWRYYLSPLVTAWLCNDCNGSLVAAHRRRLAIAMAGLVSWPLGIFFGLAYLPWFGEVASIALLFLLMIVGVGASAFIMLKRVRDLQSLDPAEPGRVLRSPCVYWGVGRLLFRRTARGEGGALRLAVLPEAGEYARWGSEAPFAFFGGRISPLSTFARTLQKFTASQTDSDLRKMQKVLALTAAALTLILVWDVRSLSLMDYDRTARGYVTAVSSFQQDDHSQVRITYAMDDPQRGERAPKIIGTGTVRRAAVGDPVDVAYSSADPRRSTPSAAVARQRKQVRGTAGLIVLLCTAALTVRGYRRHRRSQAATEPAMDPRPAAALERETIFVAKTVRMEGEDEDSPAREVRYAAVLVPGLGQNGLSRPVVYEYPVSDPEWDEIKLLSPLVSFHM